MDRLKKKFATSNPDDMLFVKDMPLQDVIEYEERHGRLWGLHSSDHLLLSMRDVRKGDCSGIESAMRKYYEDKNSFYDSMHDPHPLSDRPGTPGTKIFCVVRADCWNTVYATEASHLFCRRTG
jgi:hypothetical protein